MKISYQLAIILYELAIYKAQTHTNVILVANPCMLYVHGEALYY